MIYIFSRVKKEDGLYYNSIVDPRFKVNQYAVLFFSEFDEVPRPDHAAAAYILSDRCAAYPTRAKLSKKLGNLYDASLSGNTVIKWDNRMTTLSASALDNRYALKGEDLEAEICELLRKCLFEPVTENGVFEKELTDLMRSEVIDSIDSVINDKAAYAMNRSNMTAFKGEPIELSVFGTHEQAELITPASAFAAYKRMLETSHIEIFTAGSSDFSEAEDILCSMFSEKKRSGIIKLRSEISPLKPQTARVSDKLPQMQQAILRMTFKAPELEDKEAAVVLNNMLGSMTSSRFFRNIREKQSLCYYCSSYFVRRKNVLTAYAGVDPKNLERAEAAILAELEDIQKNGVTEDELEKSRLENENMGMTMYDSAGSLMSWYSNQIIGGEFISPEEQLERIRAVDSERVRRAARQFKLDTVYTLSGEDDR